MIFHNVFFTLHDPSQENKSNLIKSCYEYLPRHAGITFFTVGELCEDLRREVNDLEFHVALNIGFSDLQAHDAYQESKDHKIFIEQNKFGWKKVRVFDSVTHGK
ncbi:MAG: Dabb family protein [Planctomycetota bacterium]